MIVRSVKYFMVVCGIWNVDWTEYLILRIVQFWYRRVLQGIVFIFLLSVVAKLIQLILIKARSEVIYQSLSIVLPTLAIAIKVLIYEKSNMYSLLQKMIREEKRISMSSDDKLIKCYYNDVKTCIGLKNALVATTVFGSAVYLIFKPIFYLKSKGYRSEWETLQESFLYPIWLPYKESNSLISVSILNMVFAFANTNTYLATHIIPFAFMIFVAAQIKILQVLIRNLESIDSKNTNYYCVLKEIARKHLFIIKFVNMLNSKTKYIMLTNFLLYSINIACLAIEILMQNTLGKVIFPSIFMVDLILKVFLMGWFANEIKVQNFALGDLLYQTKWYNLDVRNRKLLLIVIRQTQQPLTMSIGPFGPMTMETALRIMQATYSYITLMKNFK